MLGPISKFYLQESTFEIARFWDDRTFKIARFWVLFNDNKYEMPSRMAQVGLVNPTHAYGVSGLPQALFLDILCFCFKVVS